MNLKEVVKEISPTKEERKALKLKLDSFLKKLNKNLKGAKVVLGGSGAKDTWLRGVKDADFFVLFNYNRFKNRSDELSDLLESMIKKNFKFKRVHGSRDYFQVKERNMIFEIIPVLDIKRAEQAINITDISPLHAKFVGKHKKLADDIRLMKQFCKAQRFYGAESHIAGFSGYSCEVLTIHYKGFMNLVRSAAKWKQKVVIDPMKYYRRKNPLAEMNTSKIESPLVLVDPVQKGRNVTAALGLEKFNLFKNACAKFLKKPSRDFFIEKSFDIEKIIKKAHGRKLLLFEAKPLSGKEDVVGSKLVKVMEFLVADLKKNGKI